MPGSGVRPVSGVRRYRGGAEEWGRLQKTAEAARCQPFEATHSCQTISFTPIPERETRHTSVEGRSVGEIKEPEGGAEGS